MQKKRYITDSIRYSITVDLKGKKTSINFIRVSSHRNGSAFTTDDKELQKAIEATQAFNTRVFVDETFNPRDIEAVKYSLNNPIGSVKAPEKVSSLNQLPEFSTVNEAKDYFVKEHGILVSKLQTKAQIREEGKALGFEVKFSND
jgi:hypothetical protein